MDQQLDIERQLERLGQHRQQVVEEASVPLGTETTVRAERRLAMLAVAAATLVLFATGAYLLVRAGADKATVDTVGRGDGAARFEPAPVGDGADASQSGEHDRPAPTGTGVFSELVGDRDGDEAATEDEATATSASSDAPPPTTGSTPPPADDALPQVDAAGAALADASSVMIELTAGLAGSDGAVDAEGTEPAESEARRERVANDVAVAAAGNHEDCATPSLNPDLSITVVFVDCPAEDGRPVNGALTARVARLNPIELNVVMAGIRVGADRLWMDARLALPADGADPTLSGQVLVERHGAVTYLDGAVRFRPGAAVVDGDLAYVTDTAVIGGDRVTYRPGQLIVTTEATGLLITEGSCAPSSGTADFQAHTVTGIRSGAAETHDLELLQLQENLAAEVTYRPTTPLDGRVDLRLGGELIDYRLQEPCNQS